MKNKISILYSGHQFDYLFGLLTALNCLKEYNFEVIDAIRINEEKYPKLNSNIKIFQFIDKRKQKNHLSNLFNICFYYLYLFKYILTTDSKIFHIEWLNYKSARFEELFIPFLIKLRGKKILYKVHDVSTDLLLSSFESEIKLNLPITKKKFYSNISKFIVHNNYTKKILTSNNVSKNKISVINHGINNSINFEGFSKLDARLRLSLKENEFCILFFGSIAPYKNLENLILSIKKINNNRTNKLKLIIAGKFKDNQLNYSKKINSLIKSNSNFIISQIRYIKSDEVEYFFKACDVLILPYRFIFQSGLVFLAMRFNLPIIAKNVGGLSCDIVENKTGFLYQTDEDLGKAIIDYQSSNLYINTDYRNSCFVKHKKEYSWEKISKLLDFEYKKLMINN